MTFRVGAVQMNSRDDKAENLDRALVLIDEAVAKGADLVALPENFNFRGHPDGEIENGEPIPGPTIQRLAESARRHGIYLLAGSILESVDGLQKVYNTDRKSVV